ncbi:MAG: BrxA family protein [Thermodesulfobacteriota bacterium]
MNDKQLYTTQLQAGLGNVRETRMLLEIWQPGMDLRTLFQRDLDSGHFPKVSARRLRNVVSECFAPRYLVSDGYPASLLKKLADIIPGQGFSQLLFLFTSRANPILADFVREVYWRAYSNGKESVANSQAALFIRDALQAGKMGFPWSESTIRRMARYLTRCCSDFGLLEGKRVNVRKILPFRILPVTVALLGYDLHFARFSDNAVIAHPDWDLFGFGPNEVIEEFRRLSLKGFLILQSAGDLTRISWRYGSWEDLIGVITQEQL